jgi:hypothetical protein
MGYRVPQRPSTPPPSGKLVFHLFGTLAEFERGLIGQPTQAELASPRAFRRRPREATGQLAGLRRESGETDCPIPMPQTLPASCNATPHKSTHVDSVHSPESSPDLGRRLFSLVSGVREACGVTAL